MRMKEAFSIGNFHLVSVTQRRYRILMTPRPPPRAAFEMAISSVCDGSKSLQDCCADGRNAGRFHFISPARSDAVTASSAQAGKFGPPPAHNDKPIFTTHAYRRRSRLRADAAERRRLRHQSPPMSPFAAGISKKLADGGDFIAFGGEYAILLRHPAHLKSGYDSRRRLRRYRGMASD